jgi:branched-chain amino acid transport system permease protein
MKFSSRTFGLGLLLVLLAAFPLVATLFGLEF